MDFKDRYLLACLAEECAGVQQEIMKIFRFGLDDFKPGEGNESNVVRLDHEMSDLLAVMELVRKNIDAIPTQADGQAHLEKQCKVNKWFKYARDNDTQRA